MRVFVYERVNDAAAAAQAGASSTEASQGETQFLAGGTTLVDLMKLDVMRPAAVIDINALEREHAGIALEPDRLRLGALARMSDVAADPGVRRDYPVIAQSLDLAASPQVRNMA